MPDPPDEKLRPPPEPPAEETFAPAPLDYAELDVTTNFSFLRGASHADELVLHAARLGHRAIAVTDLNTLAGVVRMFDAARQIAKTGWGPRLIVGARLAFQDAPDVLVWAPDRPAYAKLCRLLTLGRRRAPKGECHLSLHDFLDHSDGLLAGLVPPSGAFLETVNAIQPLRDALGRDRLSLVITKNFGGDEETRLRNLLSLAKRFDVPPVATNAVHYHAPGRRPLQDVLTCIRHQCTIREAGFRLFANGERYLKSPEQMHRLFADIPHALWRTMEIANRCTFSLDQLRYEYPDEIVPPGKTAIQHLTELTWSGASRRYPQGVPQKVVDLIHKEINFIERFHWEPYFLTVHDLVRYARECNILCQGRGSAANSAVCYCLHVTSVDPNKIDVLFERFISAARGEPPDIDIDFEHERREEVIQYVYEKYGRERSGMTATVITYRGRSAVRDVGKALGLGLDVVDQLAKRLDWWHRGTLSDEQLKESGVDPADPTVRALIGLTAQLLGFPRHLSQHTGGMVMTRGPLSEMVPIENASMDDRTVIEWDKDDIDALGILKVDVLALGMLTVISKAFKMLGGRYELATLPDEESATYEMICDADTVGVFQIESRAQMSMLPRLRPNTFYDLVIEVAIVRPGPIQGNMVHPYLRRRSGEEAVTFPSDALYETLKNTLGVPLFQEQAMRVVMVAAGFTADEADKLRRAMAAWRKNGAINQFYPKIINGMLSRGYTLEFAEQTFQQIQGFGEYGFPESHAASFAILVYASAWIKRHHPAVFCAALLNSQPMGFYAPAQIVIDAQAHGVEVRSVDVNESAWDCTLETPSPRAVCGERVGERGERRSALMNCAIVDHREMSNQTVCDSIRTLPLSPALSPQTDAGRGSMSPDCPKQLWGASGPAVRLGFRRIKGLQETHANVIADIRRHCGRFTSVEQMHRLTDLPVSVMRRLAEADAFESLGLTRRQALWHVMRLSDEELPLWECADVGDEEIPVALPVMPIGQEVMTDYATGGLSLKAHPVALIREQLTARRIVTARELGQLDRGWVRVAGLVLIRQRPGTASGIVFETLEDETGVVNLIVRPDIYERYRPAARYAGLLECRGYVERKDKVIHVMAKQLFDLSPMLSGYQLESRDFH